MNKCAAYSGKIKGKCTNSSNETGLCNHHLKLHHILKSKGKTLRLCGLQCAALNGRKHTGLRCKNVAFRGILCDFHHQIREQLESRGNHLMLASLGYTEMYMAQSGQRVCLERWSDDIIHKLTWMKMVISDEYSTQSIFFMKPGERYSPDGWMNLVYTIDNIIVTEQMQFSKKDYATHIPNIQPWVKTDTEIIDKIVILLEQGYVFYVWDWNINDESSIIKRLL